MNILDRIAVDKRRELSLLKTVLSVSSLEKSILFERDTMSLSENLRNSNSGIIAEHKRRSPSKPIINNSFCVDEVVQGYAAAGVCGISVLTDSKYFGGATDDLIIARAATSVALLRKEFIIDEFQIIEAKALGADAILLIAALLAPKQLATFTALAKSLGLEVLLEVHDNEELQNSLMPGIDMVGVNNRNLKTFEVSLDTSRELAKMIPAGFVKVSESGISDIAAISDLKKYGYQGFLIGEHFMKTANPGDTAAGLISQLQNLKQ